jgi:hypothetical protein
VGGGLRFPEERGLPLRDLVYPDHRTVHLHVRFAELSIAITRIKPRKNWSPAWLRQSPTTIRSVSHRIPAFNKHLGARAWAILGDEVSEAFW